MDAGDVPGTVLLIDRSKKVTHAAGTDDVFLVPQPSQDPEDPLNWSRKRKLWAFTMSCVYVCGIGFPTSMHYSVLADITKQTGIPTIDLGEMSQYDGKSTAVVTDVV